MADNSKIEWTDASWNPIRARNKATGKVGWYCEHATTGCINCYSESMNHRLGTGLPFKPGHRKDVDLFLDEEVLQQPRKWRRARMVFVCSMTDLFADFVLDRWIDAMLDVMSGCGQHTFQILTKRPARMRRYFENLPDRIRDMDCHSGLDWIHLPLPNVWLGSSAENQECYDDRRKELAATPAAVRFWSLEPLLGPIGLGASIGAAQWVIIGGESGPGARPMDRRWADAIVAQCLAARVPVFVKQLGACFSDEKNGIAGAMLKVPSEGRDLISRRLKHRKGADMSEWPEGLRVREMPAQRTMEAA